LILIGEIIIVNKKKIFTKLIKYYTGCPL